MVTVTCPECGKEITGSLMDIKVHAREHWHVAYDSINTIKNPEARARYTAFIEAAENQED